MPKRASRPEDRIPPNQRHKMLTDPEAGPITFLVRYRLNGWFVQAQSEEHARLRFKEVMCVGPTTAGGLRKLMDDDELHVSVHVPPPSITDYTNVSIPGLDA